MTACRNRLVASSPPPIGAARMPLPLDAMPSMSTWRSMGGSAVANAVDRGAYVALTRDDGSTLALTAAEAQAVADAVAPRARATSAAAEHLRRHAATPAQ